MSNNECPDYLTSLLPDKIGKERPQSRNAENYITPKCRTETFRSSFIPATIRTWNSTTNEDRNIDSIQEKLKSKSKPLYNHGNRQSNVKHAQLRMKCSKLNAHLYSLHVTDSPACACGFNNEDSEHFLWQCPLYLAPRQVMLTKINGMNIGAVDINDLLYGSENFSLETNKEIFSAVHDFISASGRL